VSLYLLIDFGSTYTKVVAIDPVEEVVRGRAQSPTTVKTDINIGLNSALSNLYADHPELRNEKIEGKMACSSAAGGLKLVAIGLVPELTLEAARRAALGAGARVILSYAYELNDEDIAEIEKSSCDIILLVGGTDGGNKDVILHNAQMLSKSGIGAPILVAGNSVVSKKIQGMLQEAGKIAEVTENILPEVDLLNVEPAREEIREIFMKRIVQAKGLQKAEKYVGSIIMPTPMASLKAAELMADGTDGEPGIGDLILIEIGGATTNVHSVARGNPENSSRILKGLPEPYAKRTVEGDLGLRYNAPSIYHFAGEIKFLDKLKINCSHDVNDIDFTCYVDNLSRNVDFVPEKDVECHIDSTLAGIAAEIAVERHSGTVKEQATVMGTICIQYGKDLTNVKTVIGTGGIFRYGICPDTILRSSVFDVQKPWSLRPKQPSFYIDKGYIMYAIGLLSERFPRAALRTAKKHLLS
jgi:uncharacterized protein (TIGR01319 family)